MNMLQVQDALKNASDSQLMREMQNPSGMAPQFLVLSEMKRRKDMRAQAAPPQGTVAEDLLAEGNQAREILPNNEAEPEYESEEEMAAGGLVGLRRYAQGGIVRMSAGGLIPMGADRDLLLREQMDRAGIDDVIRRQRAAGQDVVRRSGVIGNAMADVRAQIDAGMSPEDAIRSTLNSSAYRGRVTAEQLNPAFGVFPSPAPVEPSQAPATNSPAAAQPPAAQPPAVQPPATPPAANPPTAEPPAAQPPAGRQYDAPIGPELPTPRAASRPSQSAASQDPPAGLPALAQDPAAPSAAIPDRLSSVLSRINEGRTDPAARRSEAMNMALMEAGLRIAGSNSPRIAGAIAEGGIPALQGFSQQAAQIRQDQRQDLRDELQTAIAQNQNDFQRGRLSQQEFATRQQYLLGMARLRQDAGQAAASNAIARERLELDRNRRDRNPQLELIEALSRNPELAATYSQMHGRDEESRLAARASAINGTVNALRQLLADPNGTLTAEQRAQYQAELDQALQASRSLGARMRGGLGGTLVPGANGAPPTYQLPGR